MSLDGILLERVFSIRVRFPPRQFVDSRVSHSAGIISRVIYVFFLPDVDFDRVQPCLNCSGVRSARPTRRIIAAKCYNLRVGGRSSVCIAGGRSFVDAILRDRRCHYCSAQFESGSLAVGSGVHGDRDARRTLRSSVGGWPPLAAALFNELKAAVRG